MLKTICPVILTTIAALALAQTTDAPLSLEGAQQRARFAREQMIEAQRIAETAEMKDRSAQKRL